MIKTALITVGLLLTGFAVGYVLPATENDQVDAAYCMDRIESLSDQLHSCQSHVDFLIDNKLAPEPTK